MSLALILVLATQVEQKAPPDPAGQQAALKVVREIFREEYAKKTPSDRVALAKILLKQAAETKDDPASRFVLMTEARDLAAEAGAADTSMRAVDEMAREFKIDVRAVRASALTLVEKAAKTPEDLKSVAVFRMRLADEALAADDFDGATAASALAAALARKAKDIALAARADARAKEITGRKAAFESVKKALDTLRDKADDPAASATVGTYLCFAKNDWDGGLPFLAKGSDELLKSLAVKDLSKPAAAADQLALADAWWQLGDKDKVAKDSLHRRALYWYLQAGPQLTGLAKTRVEKRLLDGRLELIAKGTWVDLADPKLFGQTGKPGDSIKLKAVAERPVSAEYAIPGEFDGFSVRVRFESGEQNRRLSVGYAAGRYTHSAALVPRLFWTLTRIDGAKDDLDFNAKCDDRDERVITVIASDGSYVAYLDGEEQGRHPASPGRLLTLKLTAVQGSVSFDQIRLHKKE